MNDEPAAPRRRPRDPVYVPLGLAGRGPAQPRELIGATLVLLFFIALVLGAALAEPLRWLVAQFR